MMYKVKFSKQGAKDYELIKKSNLFKRLQNLLKIIKETPYEPPYEKLSGNLKDLYSRRINQKHRLVYEVREEEKIINVISTWSHYENL